MDVLLVYLVFDCVVSDVVCLVVGLWFLDSVL